MKILSGKLRGRNFYMPAGTRPTQGLTRKALFDLLGHDLAGKEFLDLFAGSGAVGLEALSHGAKKVTFVEKDSKCVETIEVNLRILGVDLIRLHLPGLKKADQPCEAQTRKFLSEVGLVADAAKFEIIPYDIFPSIKVLAKKGRKFDIVFLDPPYGQDLAKKALKTLVAYDILQPNSYIIAEHSKKETLPQSEGRFFLSKQRSYGKAILSIYKCTDSADLKNTDYTD